MIKKILVSFIFILGLVLMMLMFRASLQTPSTLASLAELSPTQWAALSIDKAVLYRGKIQYQLRCYKCHGLGGEGGWKGVSLIDDSWVYGDSFQSIYNSIYYGAGTMKGYGKKMTLSDLQAITVYVKTELGQ